MFFSWTFQDAKDEICGRGTRMWTWKRLNMSGSHRFRRREPGQRQRKFKGITIWRGEYTIQSHECTTLLSPIFNQSWPSPGGITLSRPSATSPPIATPFTSTGCVLQVSLTIPASMTQVVASLLRDAKTCLWAT